MRLIVLIFVLALFGFGGQGQVYAQSNPCSLEAVLASFEAASLSNNVQVWVNHYELSSCAENVIQGVRQMARGYTTLSSETISDGALMAVSWHGIGVSRELISQCNCYSGFETDLRFTRVENGDLAGTLTANNDDDFAPLTLQGHYYVQSEAVPNRERFRFIPQWDGADVIMWLEWQITDTQTISQGDSFVLDFIGVLTFDSQIYATLLLEDQAYADLVFTRLR